MTIGERLKQARNKKGWSQRQLDIHSGVNFTTISKIEKGKRDPQASTIIGLCIALGLSADELLGLRATEMRASPTTDTELQDCVRRFPGIDDKDVHATMTLVHEMAKCHGGESSAAAAE